MLYILCVCARVSWNIHNGFSFTNLYFHLLLKCLQKVANFYFYFLFLLIFNDYALHLKKGYFWYLSLVSLLEFSEPAFWLIVMSAIHLDLCIGSSSLNLTIDLFCYWRHWWKHSTNFITDLITNYISINFSMNVGVQILCISRE